MGGIHRLNQRPVIEDRPWLIGIPMIVMALVYLFGAFHLIESGHAFGGLMLFLEGMALLICALMVRQVRLASTGPRTH